MTPTERVQAGLSALPDSYRGAQPGGLGTMRPAKYEPTRGEIREINQKYPRGADIPAYREKKILYDFGKEMGGTTFEDSSGIERLNLNKLGIKDPKTGATMLSMMEPSLTAKAPTFSQLMGDIGRGAGNMLSGIAEAAMSGKLGFTGAVKGAWDNVRNYLGGEPTSVQGTAFPQPDSDTKDLFSSIDTGIAQVDPDNMLVQIAKANEGRFDDKPTFQDQLASATVENLNIPSPTDVAQTISDYYTAAAQGVNVDTPIGNINVNPLAQKLFLDGGIGNVGYGGSFDPNTLDYNVGIGTRLPYGVNFSAGASSSDIPGMSFSKNIGPVNTSFNLSEQGGSLGLNTVIDPLRTIFPGSSVGTPINIGASVDSRGNVNPNVSFMVPFNSGGLGYMFK